MSTDETTNNDDGYDVEPTGTSESGEGPESPVEEGEQKPLEQESDSIDNEPVVSGDGAHALEPLEDDAHDPHLTADGCPHCGAPNYRRTGPCLRCGKNPSEEPGETDNETGAFTDRSASRVIGDAVGAFERDEDELGKPLSGTGRGGFLLPGSLALLCVAVTVGGYFAGIHALFPGVDDPELTVSVGWRFLGLLRYLALIVFLVGCGLVALAVVSAVVSVPFGDLPLATIRMLSCVTAMRLVAFISISTTFLESLVELIVGVAIVLALMLLYFTIKLREACLFVGITVLCVFLIWLTAYFVIWVMTG